jgi:DNA-binding transcriptional MerR regulator
MQKVKIPDPFTASMQGVSKEVVKQLLEEEKRLRKQQPVPWAARKYRLHARLHMPPEERAKLLQEWKEFLKKRRGWLGDHRRFPANRDR